MKRLFGRVLALLLAALLGIGLWLYNDYSSRKYFREHAMIRNELQSLQTDLYALMGEILQNASFLYRSYDRINLLLKESTQRLHRLMKSEYLKDSAAHGKLLEALRKLEQTLKEYRQTTLHFLRVNAALKNSAIYIPTLQLRAYSIFDVDRPADREILLLLSKISSTLFVAKNAQDVDFIPDIEKYSVTLKKDIAHYEGSKKRLLLTLSRHLDQFLRSFPLYVADLDRLLRGDLIEQSARSIRIFQEDSAKALRRINRSSQLFLLLYLLSLGAVFYFIYRTYRENRHLRQVRQELEKSVLTDFLTGLQNRLAYRRQKSQMQAPCLILINIDRFKHINEFYGTFVGDRVLKEVARLIREETPETLHASFYRMGGDDFGILFEKEHLDSPFLSLLKEIHYRLEKHKILVEELEIDLSYTLGASDEKNWLFETADMALKAAKSSQRDRFALYTPEMDKRQEISRNIQILQTVRHAIDEGHLVPYFQAIYHLSSGRSKHFEALARIEDDNGHGIIEPGSFIAVATEAKLSGEITLRILEQTLRAAKEYPYDFSVNIASSDINSEEGRQNIIELLSRHRPVCHRIIFEILESEEIDDYERMAEFITSVKRYGCRFALDDFGSGYSNMEKLLKLDLDLLKIDGSLIRRIDHDQHAELIVQTILGFARKAGWQTVAEFVHSRSVYEKVRALGFDYAQGYFIGKPKPKPTPSLLDKPEESGMQES
ncbi:EAL domain-containing protein [Nitratifractor sp.]